MPALAGNGDFKGMDRFQRVLLLGTFAPALFCVSSAAEACASCGCTLTADWLSQGLAAQPGTTLTLRYDYVPQTTLRSGTNTVDRGAIALPADREIERYTYNHSVTFTADHQFANDWGIDIQLPVVTRPHSTIAEGTTEPSHSDTKGVGDLRVVGRWQGLSRAGSVTGIEAGLALPTGNIHQKFNSGPEEDEEVDRGLQPGSGTVQAVLGAYHLGAFSPELGYFLQTTGQVPLTSRDGFKPGSFAQVSAALNYTHWRNITPQLQLSFRKTWRDNGPNSDRPNSGGEQVNLAPGLSAKLGNKVVGFGYVEMPLYTRVNGFQLVPKAKFSIGASVPSLAASKQRGDDALERRHVDRRPAISLRCEYEAAGSVVDARDGKRRRDVAPMHFHVIDKSDGEGELASHVLELCVPRRPGRSIRQASRVPVRGACGNKHRAPASRGGRVRTRSPNSG